MSRGRTWRWWLLVSCWMHYGAIGLLWTVPAPEPADRAPMPPPIAVARAPELAGPRAAPPDPLPPQPPGPPPPEVFTPIVRSDPDAAEAPPLAPIAQSDRDTRAIVSTRAPFAPAEPGRPTPPSLGRRDAPGSATPDLRIVPENDPRAGAPAARHRSGLAGGGSGRDSVAAGEGTPGASGDRSDGTDPIEGGTPGGASFRAAHDPDWWQPTVVRVVIPRVATGENTPPADRRSPRHARAGGTDGDAPSPGAPGRPTETPTEAVIAQPTPGFEDPVERVRAALGWGPIDRATLGPRPAWADPRDGPGAAGTAPPIAADLPASWEPAADLEGTALGRYVARVEDDVLVRWRSLDLTIGDRARGVAGRVGVRYRIAPDGRTSAVHVSSSSGYALLDTLALRAIPERVPPFPAELGREEPLWHEIVLRYHNPFVATGL